MFITFRTRSQAVNYCKRISYYHDEGCGCCHHTARVRIDGNKVLLMQSGEDRGSSYLNVKPIGKIKSR